MNISEMTKSGAAPPPGLAVVDRQRLRPLWIWVGPRRAAIALGLAAVGGGLALNWGWLTAIGVAPVLVAIAPCAAMCALGLCMPKMIGGNSGAADQSRAPEQIAGPLSVPTAAVQPSETEPT